MRLLLPSCSITAKLNVAAIARGHLFGPVSCRRYLVPTKHTALAPTCTRLHPPVQLESEKSKLQYQCLHLKRAVAESDEKLAALQAGK